MDNVNDVITKLNKNPKVKIPEIMMPKTFRFLILLINNSITNSVKVIGKNIIAIIPIMILKPSLRFLNLLHNMQYPPLL